MTTETTEGTAIPYTADARWESLVLERRPFLDRARESASLTIPGILPPEGTTGSTELAQPYQSVGADGVNSLAAKLLNTLFPAGSSFFRLTMDDFVVEELAQKAGDELDDERAQFEEALGKVERAVMNRMETKGTRKIHFEALVHLIVTGNGLVQILQDGSEKFYSLENFCIKRDLAGNVTEIVVKETLARSALPPRLAEFVKSIPETERAGDDEKTICLYTWVQREDGKWKVSQQIAGKLVPETEGSYPIDKSPWLPLRWRIVPGEDYGRGHCEEHIGDLRSIEALRQAIIEMTVAVAKTIFLRSPSAATTAERFAKAPNGAFLEGTEKDVFVLRIDKTAEFTVAKQMHDDIKHALERAFLSTSSVQRDAERVTAEEIRAMVAELEGSLGGVYSLLSEELQRPLVVRYMHQMTAARQLPQLPASTVSPQIVTGLDGLGRNSDLQKLDVLIKDAATTFGPEAVAEYINVGAYMKRRGAYVGLDTTGLIRSEQEVEQTRQASAQSQMTEKLAPHLMNLVGKGAQVGAQQQQSTQP